MADPIESDLETESDAPEEGIGAHASGALGSFIDHVEARIDLFRLEAREAQAGFFRRCVMAGVGIAFFGITYLAGLIGLIGWIARQSETGWEIIMLWTAAIHLVGGGILLWMARRSLPTNLFEDSIEELRKDRDRLRRASEPPAKQ